jgi:hypothetical protein
MGHLVVIVHKPQVTSVGRTDGFEAQAIGENRERRSLVGRSGHHAPQTPKVVARAHLICERTSVGDFAGLGEPGCDLVESKVQAL